MIKAMVLSMNKNSAINATIEKGNTIQRAPHATPVMARTNPLKATVTNQYRILLMGAPPNGASYHTLS